MAVVQPLRAIRYAPDHVRLGGVLAPPYDVIGPDQRARLYGRDLRNVVRIDFGEAYPGDHPGANDPYTRAADHLESWLGLGLLVREQRPSFYVCAHDFVTAEARRHRRLGIFARVRALPWGRSDVLPHERTLRGPKEDRMALMRATHAQTSPVWAMWSRAPGLPEFLERIAAGTALLGGRTDGEVGSEKLRLWRVDDDDEVAEVRRLFDPATLYIADGHHRFETAAAYAEERRAAGDGDGSDSQYTLIYASAADDPSLILLPTHRLLLPRQGMPHSRDDLGYRLDDAWTMEPVEDPVAAAEAIAARRGTHHSFVVVAPDGAAVLERRRVEPASPRAGLDVVILQEEILKRCGVGEVELQEGALGYSRDPGEAVRAVGTRRAALAFLTSACTAGEVIAVADAGETMPQKSTYFYPKVPTGLVLSPL